jgi:hypothetical protein
MGEKVCCAAYKRPSSSGRSVVSVLKQRNVKLGAKPPDFRADDLGTDLGGCVSLDLLCCEVELSYRCNADARIDYEKNEGGTRTEDERERERRTAFVVVVLLFVYRYSSPSSFFFVVPLRFC